MRRLFGSRTVTDAVLMWQCQPAIVHRSLHPLACVHTCLMRPGLVACRLICVAIGFVSVLICEGERGGSKHTESTTETQADE